MQLGGNQVLLGDSIEVLRGLPDASIDSVVTDPPYGLAFMGKKWDYDVPSEELWRECLRVLKPGGHLVSFSGTRTYHRMVVRIEDAGFEIRDQLAWVYGSGFPKSRNQSGAWQGWGTALKPAWEPICLVRKPLAEKNTAANVLAHGTGVINVDGCRIGGNSTGRWPANLCHDGSDEVLAAFPEAPGQIAPVSTNAEARKTQNVYGAMKRGNGRDGEASADRRYADKGATNFAPLPGARRNDSGSAARFFYCAKASKKDREEGNDHPTVKPTPLMQWLCRLVTPPGGVVLDPFMGSGSTGKAAVREGFQFVGIEREEKYHAIAVQRIANEVSRAGADLL